MAKEIIKSPITKFKTLYMVTISYLPRGFLADNEGKKYRRTETRIYHTRGHAKQFIKSNIKKVGFRYEIHRAEVKWEWIGNDVIPELTNWDGFGDDP